jgi:hypothetical protein
MNRIIGIFMIIGGCFEICFAIWHLVSMLKTPKDRRIWWGEDVVIQLFYPFSIFVIIIGIYQFMI